MTTYYKFLRNGGYGTHAHDYRWNLPTDGQPAAWEPKITGRLIPCENGYHVLTLDHWDSWASDELYEVETRGELLDDGKKLLAREARLIRRLDGWNEQNIRLFAADCAEHVLPIWVRVYPDDARPRLAIKAARDYAYGRIVGSIRDAAWDAARDAARGAAWDAAWDAARDAAWDAARAAAEAVARDAARAAARDAARAVAGAAARAAARDAAGDAAWDAALAAAGDAAWAAARAAARDAALAAAGDAAWDAAWDAERSWQLAKLREYLGVEE